jgi:hypothetical protein
MPVSPLWSVWKRSLPPPYNLDLAEVLQHLNRDTEKGCARLANDPVTASFLRAGMGLLYQHLGTGGCMCPHQHDRSGLLSFLSQQRIAEAMKRNPRRFSRSVSVPMLRDRWARQKGFITDLIRFAMWQENYRPGYRSVLKDLAGKLTSEPDLAQAVHEITYRYAAGGTRLPPVRLSLALMAICGEDPDIADAISRTYRDHLGRLQGIYQETMSARRLRLRPGLTPSDLTNAISAATDGVILRAAGDPRAGVLDHARRKSLAGLITLAIIYAFLEPEDGADGLTLEQAVTKLYCPPPGSV